MAKNTTLKPDIEDGEIDGPEDTGNDNPPTQTKPEPTAVKTAVYTFRIKGTNRTYDVDYLHLAGMRSRQDAEYIGSVPLPPPPRPQKKNENPT